jgi:diaminohydroxyphosphoribosylaminopyrimidine deaminase/5-amino-6-(5-phosphoribosylamino)uracil reductase
VTAPAADDAVWMAEAQAQADTVRTTTSPNPWVGCVIVPSGDGPVALGATEPPGGPHAEAVALAVAGPAAAGATVFVTLEPCSHHGRTPPCADALIRAGVARVVVALLDPDPRVSGQGVARLKAAGIPVDVGVGAAAAEASLAPYLKHRRTGRPSWWAPAPCATTTRSSPPGTPRADRRCG